MGRFLYKCRIRVKKDSYTLSCSPLNSDTQEKNKNLVFFGSKEGFAKYLRRAKAKDDYNDPPTKKTKTYIQMVNDATSGEDNLVYIWSNLIPRQTIIKEATETFNIYLGTKKIDTVSYGGGVDAEEVRDILINNKGYNSDIKVVKESVDVSFLNSSKTAKEFIEEQGRIIYPGEQAFDMHGRVIRSGDIVQHHKFGKGQIDSIDTKTYTMPFLLYTPFDSNDKISRDASEFEKVG